VIPLRGDSASRPGAHQPTVQTDSIKYFHSDRPLSPAPADHQSFHNVKTIQLDLGTSQVHQVPARRRRTAPHTPTGVQRAAPLKDPADRSQRRNGCDRFNSPTQQFPADGGSAIFSQVAFRLESFANNKDLLFHLRGHTVRPGRATRRFVREVDTMQPLITRAPDPALNGTQADAKPPRSVPQRMTGADKGNETQTASRRRVYLPLGSSSENGSSAAYRP